MPDPIPTVPDPRSPRTRPAGRISAVLILVGLLGLLGLSPTAVAAPPDDEAAGDGEPTARDLMDAMGGQLERSARMSRAFLRDVPRDHWEPAATLATTDGSPDGLLAFVRDETDWIPYHGAMRGPVGVLHDRSGNHLDRALLLAELARLAGLEVRLARAGLPLERARELWTTILEDAEEDDGSSGPPAGLGTDELETLASRFELPVGEVRSRVEQGRLDAQRVAEDVHARVVPQTDLLTDRLGWESTASADEPPAPTEAELLALRDHWWVQVRAAEDDAWTDLDPAHPEHRPDDTLVAPVETVAPADLAAERHHRLRVRVVAERWTADGVEENVALEHTARLAAHVGDALVVGTRPMSWPDDLNPFSGEDAAAEALRDAIHEQTEWLPIVKLGDETVRQSSIRIDGTINENPQTSATGQGFQRAHEALGGMGGGGPDAFLTGVFLRLSLIAPGGSSEGSQPSGDIVRTVRTVERPLLDLVGAAARDRAAAEGSPFAWEETDARRMDRSTQLLGVTRVLPQTCWLHPLWITGKALSGLLVNRMAILGILDAVARERRDRLPKLVGELERRPTQLHALARARRTWSLDPGKVAITEPSLLGWVEHPRWEAPEGSDDRPIRMVEGYDILHAPVGFRPGAPVDRRLARLAQGVVDTNAESVLHAMRRAHAPGESTGLRSPSGRFARAIASGSAAAWTLLRDPSDLPDGADPVGLGPDATAHVRADLEAGHAVLVPGDEGPDAAPVWWRIDPDTGATLGLAGPHARGQDATEYLIKLVNDAYTLVSVLGGVHSCAKEGMESGNAEQYICCMRQWAVVNGVGVGYGAALGAAGASTVAQAATNVVYTESTNMIDGCD